MLQKQFVILFVLITGLAILAGCGGQAATPLPTETPTAEPPTDSVTQTGTGPTAEATIEQPTQEAVKASNGAEEFSESQDSQSKEIAAEPDTQPTATPPPVPSETEESIDISEIIPCDGTLTPTQAEGPFYTPNTPERTNLVEPGMGGIPLLVTGKVLTQNCEPISGATLDFWQTDDHGEYDNIGYRMRGHQFTDENGNYTLETILPERYPGRTPHIHVKVFATDGRELLTSQIYFPGISDQIPDGIFRPDLLAQNLEPDANGRQQMAFDFIVAD
jgi:protocatechuate 3,4-dioxygenase beta subunit